MRIWHGWDAVSGMENVSRQRFCQRPERRARTVLVLMATRQSL